MEAMCIREIVEATGGDLLSGSLETELIDVVTDSRIVGEKHLFVPLKGERFDGHHFIPHAFDNGAAGCVTEQDATVDGKGKCIIKVADTLTALQDIARYYRDKFSIPFIGITGSVGKTTTKDMIALVLEQKYNVLKTAGNFNNEIGLPLTVFRLSKNHDMGVVEMGMSGFGEISRLVSVAKPQTAIITNIGLSHIEKLGSKNNILKAKMEIFETFHPRNLAILNGDDPLLYALKDDLPFRTLYFGIHNEDCGLKAQNILSLGEEGSQFDVETGGVRYTVKIPVMGEHNIYNALAAIAVGLEYKVDIEEMTGAMLSLKPGKMRLDIFESNGTKIINDCYNASPASMKAAIEILAQFSTGHRTLAILGDMLEMGDWALEAHKKVGSDVVHHNIHYLITVGRNGENIALGAVEAGMAQEKVLHFDTNEAVIHFLEEFGRPEDVLLIKGSRGMKMEEIVAHLSIRKA